MANTLPVLKTKKSYLKRVMSCSFQKVPCNGEDARQEPGLFLPLEEGELPKKSLRRNHNPTGERDPKLPGRVTLFVGRPKEK